jgi:hypothetical protein
VTRRKSKIGRSLFINRAFIDLQFKSFRGIGLPFDPLASRSGPEPEARPEKRRHPFSSTPLSHVPLSDQPPYAVRPRRTMEGTKIFSKTDLIYLMPPIRLLEQRDLRITFDQPLYAAANSPANSANFLFPRTAGLCVI